MKSISVRVKKLTPTLRFNRTSREVVRNNKDVYVGDTRDSISVYVVPTSDTPVDWLHNNVKQQGYPFDPKDASVLKINNQEITYAQTGCCAGYLATYVMRYKTADNNPLLIIFTSDSPTEGKQAERDAHGGNYLLDTVMSTIKSGK
jgi:hypothetical protein